MIRRTPAQQWERDKDLPVKCSECDWTGIFSEAHPVPECDSRCPKCGSWIELVEEKTK